MDQDMFTVIMERKQNTELSTILEVNKKTERFGLSLTMEQAKELIVCRNQSLRNYKRVEFGKGILEQLIFVFCDSGYITQDCYLTSMEQLQDIFYQFKNESEDKLTDDELLDFMKEQFETICYGDLDYLADTCLQRFTAAIRAGYTDYHNTGIHGVYDQFDEETRWDKNIFYSVLNELLE